MNNTCPICKNTISTDDYYCSGCGFMLKETKVKTNIIKKQIFSIFVSLMILFVCAFSIKSMFFNPYRSISEFEKSINVHVAKMLARNKSEIDNGYLFLVKIKSKAETYSSPTDFSQSNGSVNDGEYYYLLDKATINGKNYYRIGKNKWISTSDFIVITSRR